jgi:hypothetical protein
MKIAHCYQHDLIATHCATMELCRCPTKAWRSWDGTAFSGEGRRYPRRRRAPNFPSKAKKRVANTPRQPYIFETFSHKTKRSMARARFGHRLVLLPPSSREDHKNRRWTVSIHLVTHLLRFLSNTGYTLTHSDKEDAHLILRYCSHPSSRQNSRRASKVTAKEI